MLLELYHIPTPLAVVYGAVLLVATVTDLRSRRIPNVLTIPALLLALGAAVVGGWWPSALAGALVGGMLFVLPMLIYGLSAAGAGDVKLALFLGAAVGLSRVLTAMFFAGLTASVVVVVGLLARRLERRTKIPFGPFIAIGGWVVLLFARG